MGKSQTIQQEANVNQEFQEYLDQCKAKLADRCAADSADFESKVAEYYQGTDMNVLAAGEKWNFRQTHDVGIEHIQQEIQETLEKLFGKVETGSDEGLSSDALEAFRTILSYKNSAISVATTVIVGAMKLFSSSIDIKFDHQYTATALAPGLTVHLTVANDSFSNDRFLSGERIIESYLRFKLIFSYKKGYADFGIAEFIKQNAYISDARGSVLAMKHEILTGLAAHTMTLAEAKEQQETAKFMQEMLDEAEEEVQKMISRYMLEAPAAADGKVRALPMGREELTVVRAILADFQD